jgi:CheY-like chemotaxis protein
MIRLQETSVPSSPKILIVDDSTEVRAAVAASIARDGKYELLEAVGEGDARTIVARHSDLRAVFIDQALQRDERGGLRVLRTIHHLRPLLPTIVYMAGRYDARRDAIDSGALWYLHNESLDDGLRLAEFLRTTAALAEQMPVDADPRFLKEVLDGIPTQIMVRDGEGRIYLQNRARREMHGRIEPGTTCCWHQFEGRSDDPGVCCPEPEANCACACVFHPCEGDEGPGPVRRIWPGRGLTKGRSWWLQSASGIRGGPDEIRYAVETVEEITARVALMEIVEDLAAQVGLGKADMLRLVTDGLVERVGFARASLWSYDPLENQFACYLAQGYGGRSPQGLVMRLPPGEMARLQRLQPIPLTRSRMQAIVPEPAATTLDPAEAGLWAPLSLGGRLAGLLFADRRGQISEHLAPGDLEWMSYLTQHVAALVERIEATSKSSGPVSRPAEGESR